MIEIQINGIEEIIKTLKLLASKTENNASLMRNIAGTMEAAVLTNFDVGGRPRWLGIKYRDGSPLVDTENLMSSITSDYDKDVAIVGTNEAYAAIHQFGGKAGRGRKVDIPARPFLMLTPQDEEDILQDVQDYWQSILK
ncbi:phage virion morphogenesis protein [Glaesserella parasuis]|uniref:Mu-like prophage FluMu G protein 2 n=5 Tax=Glaesserella parasuis TaxID=738 RepID=A0A836MEJ7_GLAPU|nr:phage virion morphogenesis protein [Glaesserella parasuis]YP_007002938.1 tail completion or Neck1 protein [Haemophilus phage SuMu]ABX51979.2 Mu-like prophage protein gpG [Haemophilus phage SuMu]KDB48304.1 Mu-like prophage FluMu G protein 2 [Glaesserella parasuis HPS10]MCT8525814.1 phage virion morphogenesis protein [Glaesserella parasuis]MCT8527912.1 phage virion morphogenesis protein [Glaesserella parasuis]MCT8529703.1 phage virion morphogenesis protein [Glaesserella parasuis]